MMMLVYMYKRQFQQNLILYTNNNSRCLTAPIISTYATKTNVDSSEFKISFLKNKCGLSGKSLIRACRSLNFDSCDQRPDSVVDLFRTFGFPLSSITKIISNDPRILRDFHPQNILKPKLDFLLSISLSQAEVVAIVTKNPRILARSLANYLKPSLKMLDSITGSYTTTLSVLKYNPKILCYDLSKTLLLNTQVLLTLGVSHSQILKFFKSYGRRPVFATPHDKFRNSVLKLKDMGFDLESSYFCNAVHTLCFVTDSTWKSKCVLFRSFGFSNDEILLMFKKLPLFMCFSQKNIIASLDFFVNKLQWTPSRLLNNPVVLAYSLQKRTIPRCSVLQVLFSKKLASKSYMLSTIVAMPQRQFLKEFVNAHKDEVPEVMDAYHGKLNFDEYTFKQKGQ
ncbi:hypothetical protein POM88_035250 [Heracleum sosnowskyi]|uniref:Uncharacterized protein n=1 Tax=Heracleum sosnowskyi TaxID=360622 RepID=A0AAD8HLZ1_9APIA|nr:hypothetical protein POM88_035250 [Heracleum sosnowskyi]